MINLGRSEPLEYPRLRAHRSEFSYWRRGQMEKYCFIYAYCVSGDVLDFLPQQLFSFFLSLPPFLPFFLFLRQLHRPPPKYTPLPLTRTWLAFKDNQFPVTLVIKICFKIPVNIRQKKFTKRIQKFKKKRIQKFNLMCWFDGTEEWKHTFWTEANRFGDGRASNWRMFFFMGS